MPGHVQHVKRNGKVVQGYWRIFIELGKDAEGKRQRLIKYFRGKKEEAEAYKEQLLAELRQQTYVRPSRVTVGEWLETWLNEYKKPPKTRPTTWQNYEYLIRVHIKPAIGHLQLQDLQPHHLQRLYNRLHSAGRADGAGGLSARTVQMVHTVMHGALRQAAKNGLVARNVAEATSLPKRQKKEPRILTPEEQARFFEVIQQDRLGAAFLLDLGTGMRRGELLGLKWEDVNLKEGVIRVRRELVEAKDPETGKRALIFQEPKSEKGRRSIPLPEWAVAALKAHRKRQLEEKLALGEAYQDHGLVFCTEKGTPIRPRNLNRTFTRLKKRAGVDGVTPHGLRHTYATRLLELGEHPKVVQELLGHSQISLTLDTYSHVLPELKRQAAAKLNDLFPKSGVKMESKSGSETKPEPAKP
ncbi:MAG: tyrosine-type recombinase/integrase [Moorellales bacterium]